MRFFARFNGGEKGGDSSILGCNNYARDCRPTKVYKVLFKSHERATNKSLNKSRCCLYKLETLNHGSSLSIFSRVADIAPNFNNGVFRP